MKVALIRNFDECLNSRQVSFMQRRAGVLPHLGLSYIETALERTGSRPLVIDAQAEGLTSDDLRRRLEIYQPELVGVTTTTPGMPGAVEACRIAKEVGAIVILGGPHTEVFVDENFVHEVIDYVGVGEGATIMPELVKVLNNGGDPSRIRGLNSRDFKTSPAPMLNLEDMGWPSRRSVPTSRYHSIMAKSPFATMISSRGCPFQCSFCFKQAVDKKSMYRSARDVVGEMEHLVHDYGVREIMFYDDVFTMKKKRVFEICELIRKKRLNVRWEAPTRVDLVDQNMLEVMAKAGCVRLRFGIESGSVDILAKMKKKTDIDEIRSAVLAAKRAGIETFAYFIVGWLEETDKQYIDTIEMAKTLSLDYASFYTATPLPGTQLFRDAVAANKVDAEYWHRYVRGEEVGAIGPLSDNAEGRSRLAYKAFYLRPRKIPLLIRHLSNPKTFNNVASGLVILLKSKNNFVRDI